MRSERVTVRPPRVALAGGAAFTFGYTEHVELLAAAGAEVVTVDPLRDVSLPAGADALVIGGGFPEEHADELSANTRLRAEVAVFAARGAPVAAECAGLLYLARALDGRPMCGVLDTDAAMGPRLTLGYRTARAAADSPLLPAGATVRAHEFHRTLAHPSAGSAPAGGDNPPRPPDTARPAWTVNGRAEGFVRGRVVASYLHLHWAGTPGAAARLVTAALAGRA